DFLDYSWTPSTGLDDHNSREPLARPTATTEYMVTASPPSGYPCPGSNSTVAITIDPTGIQEVNARSKIGDYPNPNQGNFTVLIESPDSFSELDYTLIDFFGRTIHTGSVKATAPLFKQELHFPDLSAGVYTLKVTVDDRKM